MKVTAILTTFNRRDQTLECLARLSCSAQHAQVQLKIVLVDDASTDGTADSVRMGFPEATVMSGSGDLYWCRGMYLGLVAAMQVRTDYLLWLNDDTQLHQDALQRMLRESLQLQGQFGRPVIMVGATGDSDGRLTYGGAVERWCWRRLSYRQVWDAQMPTRCEVMNGNCVLVPWAVAKALGNVDRAYEHAMGDTDYALRAGRAGYQIFVASGFAGYCSSNSLLGTYQDNSLTVAERWRRMLDRKGLPWRSWLRFTQRHGGFLWPIYFVWPYVKMACLSLPSIGRRGI